MVDVANVPRVMALTSEAGNLNRAIDRLNADGRLALVVITGGGDGEPVRLPTADWEYPPAMIAVIIDKCRARLGDIDQELTAVGVTGVETRAGKR